MLTKDAGFAIFNALVAGTQSADDMTTSQLVDLCKWNDHNGEFDQREEETAEEHRSALLSIVSDWINDERMSTNQRFHTPMRDDV